MFDNLVALLKANGLGHDTPAKVFAGSLVDPTSTVSGAVQNTVYTLNTVTLPADLLSRASRGLLIAAFGTTAGNANAKDLALKIGATTIASVTGSTANAKDYLFLALVLRTAVDAQIVYKLLIVDGALVAASCGIGTATLDESTELAVTQSGANTAAAAASATGKGLAVILLG